GAQAFEVGEQVGDCLAALAAPEQEVLGLVHWPLAKKSEPRSGGLVTGNWAGSLSKVALRVSNSLPDAGGVARGNRIAGPDYPKSIDLGLAPPQLQRVQRPI